MKRTLVFCLTVAALLSMAHHAPAPIVEESPKPAATAKPRPKPKVTPEATPKPKPTPFSFAGTWDTTFHEMRLNQTGGHISGTYAYRGGVIDGTISGNVASGSWTQTNSSGAFRFFFSNDGNSFSGTWSDQIGFSGPWSGKRK